MVLAHRLASALIKYQTASGGLAKTLRALSDDLAAFAPDPPPVPASFMELVGIGEQVEGVRFAAPKRVGARADRFFPEGCPAGGSLAIMRMSDRGLTRL